MKYRADLNEQHLVLTFVLNFILTDMPIEILKNSTRRRRDEQLEKCAPQGRELVNTLLATTGVYQVNISPYEIEVLFLEQYGSDARRAVIAAIMKAAGGVLKTPDEYVIVTTDASRGEDIPSDIDRPTHED